MDQLKKFQIIWEEPNYGALPEIEIRKRVRMLFCDLWWIVGPSTIKYLSPAHIIWATVQRMRYNQLKPA